MFNDDNRKFLLNAYKHILKIDDKYCLVPAYTSDASGKLIKTEVENDNECTHNCWICKHHFSSDCLLRSKLENCKENEAVPTHYVAHCDAYSPMTPLNIIRTEQEMIDFISIVENFFDSVEEYEDYFGFERNWDEESGKILESVREYYNRGGKFKNIPTTYPCVIYFGVVDVDGGREYNDKLLWITT